MLQVKTLTVLKAVVQRKDVLFKSERKDRRRRWLHVFCHYCLSPRWKLHPERLNFLSEGRLRGRWPWKSEDFSNINKRVQI